eukprot:PhF_6_TR31857/c0_g1_i1/m.47247
MMGGWALRLTDLRNAVTSSTSTLRYENQQLQRLLHLCREVKDSFETLRTKVEEAKNADFSKSRFAYLPRKEIEDLNMKTHDLKDQLAFMCKTHQFPFNPQLDEYIKRHQSDSQVYIDSETLTVKLERKSAEEKGWLIHQCEMNVKLLHETKIELDGMRLLYHERNKVVLQNEGYIIHIIHHVSKLVESVEEFVEMFHANVAAS